MIFSYLTYLLLFVQGSLTLRIIGIGVPSEVAAGRDVLLQCHYDLEGSPLYALKWYKGSHEFYRFILKEVPPVQIFPWSSIGIHHEETRSRIFAAPLAGRVLLRNVTSAAEGVYKCEISTEAPYFDTEYEEANLSVVEVTHQHPTISLLSTKSDQDDDVFHFKCSMNGTRPASRLSWLLNGQPVPAAMVLQADPVLIRNEAGGGHLYSTESELRLPVRPHLMRIHPHQQLQVTCLSRVGYRSNILEGRSEWIVEPLTRTTPSWPSDPGGGVHQAVPAGTINSTLMGPVQGSSQDETAQSISDSEGPSRRTQPVVGSYPGRGNNRSSSSPSVDNASNESLVVGTDLSIVTAATGCCLLFVRRLLVDF